MRCLLTIVAVASAFVVLTVAGLSIFYLEENARGARDWEVAQSNLERAGESVDFRNLIPPEIPADQNLANIPLLRVLPTASNQDDSLTNPLAQALEKMDPHNDSIPKVGSWGKGEVTDFGPIEKYLSARYQEVFKDGAVKLGPLEEYDALFPALNELQQAGKTRSLCRFDRDYTSLPPYNHPLGPTTRLLKLSKVINVHSLLALHANRPDLAMEDIRTTLTITGGVRKEPILISGLVAAAMVSIQLGTVWEGLGSHAWTDQQLAELQRSFEGIDFFNDYQLCVRGEALGFLEPTLDYTRDHLDAGALILGMANSEGEDNKPSLLALAISWSIPKGWFNSAKARGVTLYFKAARDVVDIKNRRVFPEIADQLTKEGRAVSLYDPPDILLGVASGPIFHSAASFAEAQFRVDAAVIACSLERFRLAKGKYPEALPELSAYFPEGLPHDAMTGESYHYNLEPDGTYRLYSVGWNQEDDGGNRAFKTDQLHSLDRDKGDWVWPFPKAQ